MITSRLWALRISLILLTAACAATAGPKTDVLHLRNGDRLTCEIKKLERGRLQVSTDSMSTVYVEWKDIARVSSNALYVVELQDGSRVEGVLAETGSDGELRLAGKDRLTGEDRDQAIPMAEVVWLDPLKLDKMIIKRWDGSVSAGFDATKANSDTSLTASFDARRRAEDFLLNFNGSVYSRSQSGTEDSLRADFASVYRRLLADRWYWAVLGSLERNDELDIDLRTLVGTGYGRFLVQTGRTLWSVTGGLAAVNEQLAGDEDAESSLEAFFNTDYEFFTYDSPKTTLTTSLTLFPSLTESGRLRGQLDFALRRELITDLFIELSVYDSYDSEPPEGAETNDYGIVTSLGYTF